MNSLEPIFSFYRTMLTEPRLYGSIASIESYILGIEAALDIFFPNIERKSYLEYLLYAGYGSSLFTCHFKNTKKYVDCLGEDCDSNSCDVAQFWSEFTEHWQQYLAWSGIEKFPSMQL
jgi:hypothetical protein